MRNVSEPNLAVALTKCFFCGKDDKIVINMRLNPTAAAGVDAAHRKVLNMSPCPECAEYMKQGVILITIDDAKSDKDWSVPPPELYGEARNRWMPNPYRTGGFFVVKDEAIKRLPQPKMVEWALKHRWIFIEHEMAKMLGLFENAQKE